MQRFKPSRGFRRVATIIPLCSALLIGLGACGPGPNDPMSANPGISSQSRAQVQGQIILPYRAQDMQAAAVNPVSYFLGAPAYADNVKIYVVPVTRTDLTRLQAYVNGQPVSLRVSNISFSGDQTVLSYQIDALPVADVNGVYLLEVRLPNGDPLVGGVLSLVPGSVNTYNLTVETTALLDSVREFLGTRPVTELTIIRVREIERRPEFLGRSALIRALLQREGKLRYTSLHRFDLDDDDDDDDHDDKGRNKGHGGDDD